MNAGESEGVCDKEKTEDLGEWGLMQQVFQESGPG